MGPQCKWRKLPAGWNAGVAFPAARHRAGLRELRGAARAGRPASDLFGTVTAGPAAGRRPAVAAGPLRTREAANGPRRLSGTGRPLALGPTEATLTQGRSCTQSGEWAPPPQWDREATGTGPQATRKEGEVPSLKEGKVPCPLPCLTEWEASGRRRAIAPVPSLSTLGARACQLPCE